MKTKIVLSTMLLVLAWLGISSKDAGNPASSNKAIKICTTPETRNLIESWVTDYSVNNPGISFNVRPLNPSEFSSELSSENTLGFILKNPGIQMFDETKWQMIVGHDVIVPVINRENPYIEILNSKGISAKELSDCIKTGQQKSWKTLLKNNQDKPVQFYILNEPRVQLSVSKFLNIDPAEIKSLESKSSDEILSFVSNDIYAIAFCRLADIVDAEKQDFIESLAILPVDKNGNGKLDFNENVFANLENFERGVWIGKYPKSLIYNICAVSAAEPANEAITGFLSWVVTSGQHMVAEHGYSGLISSEVRSNLDKLTPSAPFPGTQPEIYSRTKAIILVVITFVLVLFFVMVLFKIKGKSGKKFTANRVQPKTLNEEFIKAPRGLFYDKTHTWVFMKKDGTVKIGIDDFLQNVTGDYTGIVMKAPGEKLSKNESAITLINEGRKINIYSPVSGTIKEINEDLVDFPSLINNSPYSWGWVYALEPSNWAREITFLQMADSYKTWIKKEFTRLKDFLSLISQNHVADGQLVYQEGGELHDHLLQQMGPKVWEDFQVRFIDTSDLN